MRRARAVVAAGACAVALLLSACGGGDARTTITFWAIGSEAERVPELIAAFERDNPDIRVELQPIPLTAAHEKLLTAFAADALPDLCQLGNTWVAELAALGALEPLQPLVDASAVVDEHDYFRGIWDTNVIDDALYGVPWYVDTRLLFYRRDLLAAVGSDHPPRDWDEWRATMAALKRAGGSERYAILLPLNEFETLLNLGVQTGDPLLRDGDARGNFESPGFRRAFAFYVDMFRQGWAPPMSDTQISNVWDEFANGYFAYHVTGPWNVGEYRRRLPPRVAGHWSTAPLPGPEGPGAAIGGGGSLVIARQSRHKREAWRLLEYLSAPAQQRRFHALTGDLPPRRSSWQSAELQADGEARAFRDQLERVVAAPKIPEWERIAQELRHAAERVVRGGQSIDDALRELDARVDAILAKRRWILARRAEAA